MSVENYSLEKPSLGELTQSRAFRALSFLRQNMLLRALQHAQSINEIQTTLSSKEVNCHLAAFYLEQQRILPGQGSRSEELAQFHDVGYRYETNPSLRRLTSEIAREGFPCVVSTRRRFENSALSHPLHTFVALDYESHDIRAVSKSGFAGPLSLVWLRDEYERCNSERDDTVWCLRRMR